METDVPFCFTAFGRKTKSPAVVVDYFDFAHFKKGLLKSTHSDFAPAPHWHLQDTLFDLRTWVKRKND